MSKELRLYPDPVLNERAKKVCDFEGMGEFTERMLKVMVDNEGIGLAANQIGVASQIFVARLYKEDEPIRLINPVVVEASGEDTIDEGCLSVPDTSIEIIRSEFILLRGYDPDGNEVEYRLEGLKARVAQHEIDHLNGILIIDYLPKRELLRFQREYNRREED
ncbi:peptide deformylase [candidate division WOR-3 bacterium]|nr:peptide deformylase [candidate division WOR-3 bacterium]